MAFTIAQKTNCVTWFIQTGSITLTQRNFRRTYRTQAPARNSILRWDENFQTTGGVERRQGHGRPATSSEVQQTILRYFNTHPRRSIRRAERDLSIPRSTIHVILRRRIRMFPYKLRIVQQLEARDYVARRAFAAWCLENLESDENFMSRIIFSDECVFHVSGKVNKHNVRIWGTERPHDTREHEAHSPKVAVWCALSTNQVVGLYYFDSSTVTGSSYLNMLNNYFLPMLPNLPNNVLFQQDGAPAHYDRRVAGVLNENLSSAWIGRRGPINWPARSPDLTPLDFFLWGHVKDMVYRTPCRNVTQLKRRITTAVRTISGEVLGNVWRNLKERLNAVIREDGGHVENL